MPFDPEPAGILGGLEAYLSYLGVSTADELEPIEAIEPGVQLSLDTEGLSERAA